MKWPKISIIMPTYNQGGFIERTIKSVLNQKYSNCEFIVMDGGSKDQTVRILKKYQRHLKWYSEPDHGQTDAINKGLRISSGNILTYLNSDDTYEPNALKTIAIYFMKHPKAQFVYGRGNLINSKDKIIGMYNDSQMDYERLFACCGISQPTAFWTREVYRVVGEFDPNFHFTMDYNYWIRVSKHFKLHFLQHTVLANTRIHKHAKTSRATHQLHLDAVRTLMQYYGKLHVDWINTLADGEVHDKKTGNLVERFYYWLYMLTKTSYYHIKYNHELPPHLQWQYDMRWLKEIFS